MGGLGHLGECKGGVKERECWEGERDWCMRSSRGMLGRCKRVEMLGSWSWTGWVFWKSSGERDDRSIRGRVRGTGYVSGRARERVGR